MRMTSTGAFPRALAAARPPKPPPPITTRGVYGLDPPPCPFELRVESLIYLFLKLLRPEISANLGFSRKTAMVRSAANRWPPYQASQKLISRIRISVVTPSHGIRT